MAGSDYHYRGVWHIKRGSRQGQSKVKERLRAKIRSKQCKHSLSRNYNVMGFDTIEINLA